MYKWYLTVPIRGLCWDLLLVYSDWFKKGAEIVDEKDNSD